MRGMMFFLIYNWDFHMVFINDQVSIFQTQRENILLFQSMLWPLPNIQNMLVLFI